MSIYDNNKELLSTLGVEGNYSTDFEVRKAILNALGGDASMCNSIYEVDLQILKIYQEGGGLGLPEQTKSVTYNTNGAYTVTPDDGYTLSNVDINVNVTTPTEVWVVPDGTKFENSTWNSLPTGFDFSNVTDFSYMFRYCRNITTVPLIDTSNGTNFGYMFSGCNNLITIPQLDTSSGTNFGNMFSGCSKITTIPQLDTSNITDFKWMFYYCEGLTSIPQLDTSKGNDFEYMFAYCTNLIEVPQLDTSKGANFKVMFAHCTNLITILGIDISKGTDFSSMFLNCSKLENINLVGSINYSISFNYCTKLTYDSVKSILTACSNTTKTTTSKTLTLKVTHTDVDGELADLIATCNTKGWTISGLTLE